MSIGDAPAAAATDSEAGAPRSLNLLFVIDTLGVAGTEHSTAAIIAEMQRRGHTVAARTLYEAGHGDEDRHRAAGLDVRPLRDSRLPGRVRELRKLIRDRRPDVVHTALFSSNIVGRLAAWGTGVPVISSLVNTTYDPQRFADPTVSRWRLRVVQAVDIITIRLMVSRLHAVSEGVARSASSTMRVRPDRIAVVHRGRSREQLGTWSEERRRDARQRLGVEPSTPVVLSVGRHEHQKAQVDLVRAVDALRRSMPDVKVFIAGREGNATATLQRALAEFPAAAAVTHVLGHRQDVPDLLCAADVLAVTSHYEGTAGVTIEAMGLRCPIVCTSLTGIEGILDDGRTALLAPIGEVHAIAERIGEVLEDPSLADRLRQAGEQEFEQRFTMTGSGNEMEKLYLDVASKGVRRR